MIRRHRALLILLAFTAALFVSDIWTYKEFVRAESYFALGARVMIERNDWLAPHAPDEQQLNKPPLTFWLIGVSYKLFGVNYGASRLPSALAALAVVAIVYVTGFRIGGTAAGLFSAGLLSSSFLFLTFARTAMSDMLLTLWVTASLTCFIFTLMADSNRFALWGYLSLALGVLTKGPVALALVAVPVGAVLLWSRKGRGFKHMKFVSGALLFLTLTVPYFLLVYLRLGSGPLRFFFIGENLQRFTGEIYGSSPRPFWFHFAAFFGDFAPWSLLIFLAAWIDWRRPTANRERYPFYVWLGWAIVLFSLSRFKLDYYLLPAMPAAALIIGPVIAGADRMTSAGRGILKLFLVIVAASLFGISIAALQPAASLSVSHVVRFAPVLITAAGLVLISVQIIRNRNVYATGCLIVTIWATVLTLQFVFLPPFARHFVPGQLTAAVSPRRVWYTSWSASDWANDLAFSLPDGHSVRRLVDDLNNDKLLLALQTDSRAVAVVTEFDYAQLAGRDASIQALAQAETYGHGGLTIKRILNPHTERLLLVSRSR